MRTTEAYEIGDRVYDLVKMRPGVVHEVLAPKAGRNKIFKIAIAEEREDQKFNIYDRRSTDLVYLEDILKVMVQKGVENITKEAFYGKD